MNSKELFNNIKDLSKYADHCFIKYSESYYDSLPLAGTIDILIDTFIESILHVNLDCISGERIRYKEQFLCDYLYNLVVEEDSYKKVIKELDIIKNMFQEGEF